MKAIKNIFRVIRWLVALLIVVFSLATFMAKSYGQTICLVMVAVLLVNWPENTSEHYLTTRYATVHIMECGNPDKRPLVMFHAASMGAHSWAENLETVTENYHVY